MRYVPPSTKTETRSINGCSPHFDCATSTTGTSRASASSEQFYQSASLPRSSTLAASGAGMTHAYRRCEAFDAAAARFPPSRNSSCARARQRTLSTSNGPNSGPQTRNTSTPSHLATRPLPKPTKSPSRSQEPVKHPTPK